MSFVGKTKPTSGPEEFVESVRTLINDLAVDIMMPEVEGMSDGARAVVLASSIPEDVRLEDVKVYFAFAVLMLAQERAK